MRYAGIDIAAEKHFVAVVDETSAVLEKSTSFTEDSDGYSKLFGLLGQPEDVALVAMEATGHYWKNLFDSRRLRVLERSGRTRTAFPRL
jgi:transposase